MEFTESAAKTVAKTGLGTHLRKYAPRQGLMLLLAVGFVALFYGRLSALEMDKIWLSFRAVSMYQWGGALAATAASFWAIGRYDAVVHRMLGTGLDARLAHQAGIAAIAISQTLGLGVLTGALVRWRMLPSVSLWQATRLSAVVALSFLAGWAVITGAALALFAPDLLGGRVIALLPVVAAIGLVILSMQNWSLRLFGRVVTWPSLSAIFSILTLTMIDTIAAAAALYILLPDTAALPFYSLYPAFLLALGAALVSGTPGGVGPFEVTLLALLPHIDAEPLLGAVLAYRVIYYALPAILGAGILARGPTQTNRMNPTLQAPQKAELLQVIENAPFAEANLLRQGDKMMLSQWDNSHSMLVAKTGQALVALRDPLFETSLNTALLNLMRAAKNQARIACLYKCAAPIASEARRLGFTVMPISREAWLDPRQFTTSTPNHRQLRRKLRKADSAGITTKHATTLPLQDMERISDGWVNRSGGERGFSMGLFTPDYVQSQRCYLALQDGQLQGFITLNTCRAEWSLDIMRQTAAAPDGTMHALLCHALADAASVNFRYFSPNSLPFEHNNAMMRKCVEAVSSAAGLRQFKAAFAPNWQTLYMAAPNRLQLCLAAYDIAREITKKSPRSNQNTPVLAPATPRS